MKKYLTIISIFLFFQLSLIYPAVPPQTLYEQGIEAFKTGNYISSELLLRKIIESDNDNIEYRDSAWYHLALSIFNQKKYKSAIFEFNRFLTSCTNIELCSLARYWIAESYFQQNDYIRSIQEFKRFISEGKNQEYTIKAYDRIGRIYFMQQRYDEAIIEWTKALGKCKDKAKSEQQRLQIGEAYFLNGDYDEAIDFLTPLLSNKSNTRTNSMAILFIGQSYQKQGKNKSALKIFSEIDESLIGETPFNEVQYFRGISYIALGNFNLATIHLKSFLSAGKDSRWINNAKYELAKIYIKENKTEEATELLEQVRKSGADQALKNSASMELSKIYFDDNIEEAIICLQEISGTDSREMKKNSLFLLSKAYIKVKRLKEAESILEKLINDYSFDKEIDSFQFLLGRVYLEENDLERAISAFNKVKQLNPFSKYINESYYYLALAHLNNNQTEEAISILNNYVKLKNVENKFEAYEQLLDIYKQKTDFKNSAKIISIIIRYYSGEKGAEEIIFKYAGFLKKHNKNSEDYYNLILKKYSSSPAAGRVLLSLGDENFAKKNYSLADNYYKQYLSVKWRKNAASVFLYRLISLERLGKYTTIVSLAESDDNIPPMDDFTSKQVRLLFGKSYFKTGEYSKAYNSYSVWRLTDLSEEDLLIMVKISIKTDDIVTAKIAADLIKTDKKLYAEALYDLSQYYISKKDNYNSYDYLARIIKTAPSSELAECAKADTAELLIKEEKYEEAVGILKEIKSEKIQLRKNSLLIISLFRLGNGKEASALTKKYFTGILKSSYSESIIRENLIYYYSIKDQIQFRQFASYLRKYPGNTALINYYNGKLAFEQKNYKSSYYYFYKVSGDESEYKYEAVYYLGLINLLQNKNTDLALRYFKKLSEENNYENKYAVKAKIDLAILSNETGDIELSKKVLMDILKNSTNQLFQIQAENLIEYFGYNKTATE